MEPHADLFCKYDTLWSYAQSVGFKAGGSRFESSLCYSIGSLSWGTTLSLFGILHKEDVNKSSNA